MCVFVCGWFLVLGSFGRLSHNDLRSKVVSEITTFPVSKSMLKREVGTRTSTHALHGWMHAWIRECIVVSLYSIVGLGYAGR